MRNSETHSEVAIVGAGPVGLTLAMLLRRHGVGVRVFEAHTGLSRHPKARGVSASTMETFHGLGIADAVRAVSLPADHVRFFRGESLVDLGAVLSAAGDETGASPHTPCPGVLCSQDRLEPVLAAGAVEAGADLLFGARVVELSENADAVELRIGAGDWEGIFSADYVVGCDGARSRVRAHAGIALVGERDLARFLSVRFRAPLGQAVRGRESTSYFISGGKGGFLAIDNDTEWIYQYPVDADVDVETLSAAPVELAALVRDAAGIPELAVEIADTMLWRMDACVAETFRVGRLLLAGDAAHQTPPTGGHGMNVGIADALTLAWQLAAVVQRHAPEGLLDRYTEERHPVASAVVQRSLDNGRKAYGIEDELLLASGYPPAEPLPARGYEPAWEIGRRLPHARVASESGQSARRSAAPVSTAPVSAAPVSAAPVSTVHAEWGSFRVVAAGERAEWQAAVAGFAEAGEPRVTIGAVALADDAAVLAPRSILVRPDGHIAAVYTADSGEKLTWLRSEIQRALRGSHSRLT